MSCSYCSNSLYHIISKKTGVRWYRRASPARVKNELRHHLQFISAYNLVWINDDDFISRPLDEINAIGEFLRDELHLRFNINATPSAVTKEKIAALTKHGLYQIAIGVQTASTRILNDVYNRHIPPSRVLKAATIISEFYGDGICVDYGFILENPYEQPCDWRDTINFFLFLPKPYSVSLYSLAFFPGTVLTNKALNEMVIDMDSISLNKDYRDSIRPSYHHLLFEANYNFSLPREINDFLLSDIVLESEFAKYFRALLANFFLCDVVKYIVKLHYPNFSDISNFFRTEETLFIFAVNELFYNWAVPQQVITSPDSNDDLLLRYAIDPALHGEVKMVDIYFSQGWISRIGDIPIERKRPASALNSYYRLQH